LLKAIHDNFDDLFLVFGQGVVPIGKKAPPPPLQYFFVTCSVASSASQRGADDVEL
jgi:hypothetical protein